jgi:hypothetical protein
MVLKTLESMGPLHAYGIARRIEQIGGLGAAGAGWVERVERVD